MVIIGGSNSTSDRQLMSGDIVNFSGREAEHRGLTVVSLLFYLKQFQWDLKKVLKTVRSTTHPPSPPLQKDLTQSSLSCGPPSGLPD